MTTISDHITYADGRPANGRVVVSWPAFDLDGATVAGGQQSWPIVNGAFSVTLYANINARPTGMFYVAVYELDEGPLYKESWIVPESDTVTLGQIRVAFPVTPSALINAQQLTSAGAQPGQFLGWNGAHWVPMFASSLNISPNTIGLGLGSTGADINVSGSPAPLGGALVLNVPDAGPAARGVLTTGAQTIAGAKTFSAATVFSAGVTITGASTIAGYTPTTRQITTSHGISGGGSLAADLALAVVDNSTTQKIRVLLNTTLGGVRQSLNFIAGSNVTLTVADNPGNDWVDVTIQSTGGGGGGATLPPGTATGDLLVWQAVPGPGFWTTLPKGAAGLVLSSTASTVSWAAAIAAATNVGDLLQWDGAAWSPLARGSSGRVLTAGASSVSWADIPLQPQTPWRSNIDAFGYTLTNTGWIGVGVATALAPIQVHTGTNQNLGIKYDSTLAAIGLRAFNDADSALIPMGFSASQYQFAGGNVGIGSVPALVATPAAILDVRSSASTLLSVGIARQGNVEGARMNGTNAAPTALASGDLIAAFNARGYNSSALSTPRGGLEIWAAENWTAVANGTYQALSTTPLGQTTPVERMRITAAGSVGIANPLTSAPFTSADPITVTGGAAASTPGRFAIAGNVTPTGLTAQLIFANYAISSAEKRLAAIHAFADPTVDSGALAFLTYTAGTQNERMRISTNGRVGINQPNPAYQLDITGDLNITGTYRVGGSPFSVTAAQTPWQQNIAGAGFSLGDTGQVAIGVTTANAKAPLHVTGQATSPLYSLLVTTQTFTWTTAGSCVRIGFGAVSCGRTRRRLSRPRGRSRPHHLPLVGRNHRLAQPGGQRSADRTHLLHRLRRSLGDHGPHRPAGLYDGGLELGPSRGAAGLLRHRQWRDRRRRAHAHRPERPGRRGRHGPRVSAGRGGRRQHLDRQPVPHQRRAAGGRDHQRVAAHARAGHGLPEHRHEGAVGGGGGVLLGQQRAELGHLLLGRDHHPHGHRDPVVDLQPAEPHREPHDLPGAAGRPLFGLGGSGLGRHTVLGGVAIDYGEKDEVVLGSPAAPEPARADGSA